jgi:apolipoprotein D and lipocalin family protein
VLYECVLKAIQYKFTESLPSSEAFLHIRTEAILLNLTPIKMSLLAIALVSLAAPSIAFSGLGACPVAKAVETLDVKNYVGLWYEIARDANASFESGDCNTAQYALLDNGTLSVKNSEVKTDGTLDVVNGSAYCNADGSGNCHVRFSDLQPWGDYRVLDTDYVSYTVIYSCTSLNDVYHIGSGWVLGRTTDVSPSLASAFADIGIPASEIRVTNHQGCPSVSSTY